MPGNVSQLQPRCFGRYRQVLGTITPPGAKESLEDGFARTTRVQVKDALPGRRNNQRISYSARKQCIRSRRDGNTTRNRTFSESSAYREYFKTIFFGMRGREAVTV